MDWWWCCLSLCDQTLDHDYDTEEDNGDDEDINWYAEDDADDEDENGDAGDINMDAALVMRKMMLMTKT